MKFRLILCVTMLFSFKSFCQSQGAPSIFASGIEGCYQDYYIMIHERGAYEVTDGEHEAILVVMNHGRSECFMAKATVKDGKIIRPVSVQKADGTFIPVAHMFRALDPEWVKTKDQETLYKITDGMSQIFQTQEKYFVRLFFHTFVHPDHGGNLKAPPAKELLQQGN
ncbi:MAG: hypothetical protein LPK25_05180 [Cyclobacteriaceae bacterium]|nr:hypothetical protein [Cyclobacteriaceae bacterium]MDX5466148.1 hypothetical protein [Cyclobacteriaceae bacterium]